MSTFDLEDHLNVTDPVIDTLYIPFIHQSSFYLSCL